ncbi:MAG: PHP domain-containing protein [Planctomycetota bacterium]
MKIDLHLHSSERSSCAHSTAEEMILAAKGFGLDAVCFTEHNRLTPEDWLAEMNERHAPLKVFAGLEIGVTYYEHCLVLGVRAPELETRAWTYEDLWRFTRGAGGHLTLCHPFRFGDEVELDIDRFPPDAIEVHSVHTAAEDEALIRETAQRVGARLLATSDAHYAKWVGVFHVKHSRPAADERDLVAILKAGDYELASDETRVAAINAEVDGREGRARAVLEGGGDVERFREETGLSAHYFNRVARGKSYRV